MRWIQWIGLWLLLFGVGCTYTYQLTPGVYDMPYYRARELARHHTATIQLKKGQRFTSRTLHFRNDSLVTTQGTYALAEVQWIRFRNYAAQMSRGMRIGAMTGAIFGGLLILSGLTIDQDDDADDTDPPSAAGAIVGGLLISTGLVIIPLSAMIGAAVGYLSGSETTFYIAPSRPPARPTETPSQQVPDP
ncbi:hypothetical protein [Rhodothermus profundi]|uniref:Lipoprotein n=1 Tax=Rhodothermus profundi TaxID=633813 RepID=A0A1M6V7B6_9BACT|nr:hypothetical protein [Rhodothermus profundi]SHK77284.1 hypothetical protein SAMN04488087_1925 [Rhodothermus profundi]